MLLDFCSFPINFNIQQGETTVNSQQKIKGKQKLSHDQVAITNTYHHPVIILHFPYRSRPDSVIHVKVQKKRRRILGDDKRW